MFDKKIHKYFHINDVVINEELWGRKLFIINGFGGNSYCPEIYVHRYGKPINHTRCNWDVKETTLINSSNRPLKKLNKNQLIKLLKTGSEKVKEEVKREIIIRKNQNIYGLI